MDSLITNVSLLCALFTDLQSKPSIWYCIFEAQDLQNNVNAWYIVINVIRQWEVCIVGFSLPGHCCCCCLGLLATSQIWLSRPRKQAAYKQATRGPTALSPFGRRHKICPKSAFCIGLCTKHMEITGQCLFCLFGHLHNFLYLEINQDQITRNKKS